MTEAEALKWIAGLFEMPGGVNANTPRDQIPAWDSLGVLTLMAALDEKFSLVVGDEQLRDMSRVQDILDLLRTAGKLAA